MSMKLVDELSVMPTLIERFRGGDPGSGLTLTCHEAHMLISQFAYLTSQVAKLAGGSNLIGSAPVPISEASGSPGRSAARSNSSSICADLPGLETLLNAADDCLRKIEPRDWHTMSRIFHTKDFVIRDLTAALRSLLASHASTEAELQRLKDTHKRPEVRDGGHSAGSDF